MGWLLANLGVSCALAGLIWTIQVVHYPLMAQVPREAFNDYHTRHTRRITIVVAPLMLGEVLLALALLAWRPLGVPVWSTWAAFALVAVCWLSTALVQVPLHGRLSQGLDLVAARRLVATNWIRTVAWTARALLLAWMATFVGVAEHV
jgi:hypothetical protein